MLARVTAAIRRAPIREQQVRNDTLWVMGEHDLSDGAITLNVPLMRVIVALHELTHRVEPTWSETRVRAMTTQLLHTLDDQTVSDLDAKLRAAIRAGRRRARAGSPRVRSAAQP